MSTERVAHEHYRDRKSLSDSLGRLVRQVWTSVDPANLDGSWAQAAPALAVGLAGAQLATARQSDGYVSAVLREQGASPDGESIAPQAFIGASDGRDLDGLLRNPITVVKSAISGGLDVRQAMASGYANLDMLMRTQFADAGRAADQVALTTRPAATGYVRMLSGKSCSRCIVLAGRRYRWNAGFNRHPRCDCIGVPTAEAAPPDLQVDPRKAFDALSPAEQDRVFTKAGAQAIRDGSDIGRTVNSRRGMYTAGGKVLTTEATTRRGIGRRVRMMPEQIYRESGGDREEALRLLRSHGYLTGAPVRTPVRAPIVTRPAPLPARPAPKPKGFNERISSAATDRTALNAAPAGLGRTARGGTALTRPQRAALRDYEGSSFVGINGALRRGEIAGRTGQTIGHIDTAMRASPLRSDVRVWRGVINAERLFGGRLNGDLSGFSWREDAYSSTSTSEKVADGFLRDGGGIGAVQMRILAPAGTKAVRISGDGFGEQAELLLERGLHFRVVADRGVSPRGVRLIDVEVLGD